MKFCHPSIKKFFVCSINIPNTQQNNEIEHINKEINLLQDRLKKKRKKSKSISKWVKAHQKNMSKKRKKDRSFSNQKNTKYSEEYISK